MNSHPEMCARSVGVTTGLHDFCDPLPGSNSSEIKNPRVFARLHLADLGPLTEPVEFQLGDDATLWSVNIV